MFKCGSRWGLRGADKLDIWIKRLKEAEVMLLWPSGLSLLFSLKTRRRLIYNRAGETNVRTFFLLSVKHVILKTWASIRTWEANHLLLIFLKQHQRLESCWPHLDAQNSTIIPLFSPHLPLFFHDAKGQPAASWRLQWNVSFPSSSSSTHSKKKKKKAERAWLGYRSHVEQGWIDDPTDAAWSPRTAETRIGQNRIDRCRPPSHACPYFSPATELEHNSNIDIQGCEIYSLPRPWIMERGYTVKLGEDELFASSHFHSRMFYLTGSEIFLQVAHF